MPSSHGEFTRAVGDAYILAAVDVHAVAVGVDLEVVDGEVVDAGKQQAEVAALRIEKSRNRTLRQFLSAMALLPTPACSATKGAPSPLRPRPLERPLPQIRPGPVMLKS